MTITQTRRIAQTTLVADMGEIARLRAELERERARANKAEKELIEAQAMLTNAGDNGKRLAELRKIFKGNDWGPSERGTLAAMLFHGWEQSQTTSHWLHVCEGGAAALADMANVSRNTANNLIQRYESAGIVSREVTKTALNRHGEPIPAKKFTPDNGDRWLNASVIAITATLPDVLPDLTNDTKQAKTDRKRKANERKLAKVAKQLQAMPCPHCGVVGELHIGCTGCNHAFTHDELEQLAEQAERREETEPTRRAQPMTQAQARKANGRRRMRDVKGIASTPRPSITYQGFDDGGISITLGEGGAVSTDCTESGQSLKITTAQSPGSRETVKNWSLSVYDSANFVSSTADIGMEGTEGGNSEGPDYDWSGWGMVNHA